ncbi:MAG: GDSL-type esterase/lipase family protein [Pseudomonadota bacterium]|nr:GDSL-type esterase/lipase family protein [Pseudomonadota bacterium]
MTIRPERTIAKLERGEKVVIAALGDSLTQGWMVRRGYVDFLREMLKARYPRASLTMIRKGIPGDTADNGLYRLRYDILEYDPDCVIVQYAINDAFMGYTAGQFRRVIGEIIEEIQADGDADIVLTTSSYIGDNADAGIVGEFYDQLTALGEEFRLPVAKAHEHWKSCIDAGTPYTSLVQYDMVHPTEEGYRLMAEAILSLF